MFKIKKNDIYVLIISAISYAISSFIIGANISKEVMFDMFNPNADSYSYLQVGEWVLGGDRDENIAYRPFLFPFITASLYSIGGVYLFWAYQLCAYVLGNFFLYKSIEIIAKNRIIAWVGSFFYLINFSLIGLSYHALCEVSVIFGLSIILYLATLRYEGRLTAELFWSWLLFSMGLLVLVKPVFLPPFYFCSFLVIILVLLKRIEIKGILKWPIAIVFILLISQLMIMKTIYNEATISKISDKTYRNYLLSQVIMVKENVTRDQAIEISNRMNKVEIYNFSIHNYTVLGSEFLGNLKRNIQADSFIVDYNNTSKNAIPGLIMKWYNLISLYVYMYVIFIGCIYFLFQRRFQFAENDVILVFFWGLSIYYVFVTGISYDQRDRLVIGALPLMIFLFITFSNFLFNYYKNVYIIPRERK
jgi:hypothetical protein